VSRQPRGADVATSVAEQSIPTIESGALASLDDLGLVLAFRNGEERAFEALYARHQAGILSFCRHMLGNREDGEDALQQTFLAAYRHLQSSGAPDHPRAWLYAIARNRCRSIIRARRESSSEEVEASTAGLAEEVEQRYELQQLLRDVGRLPADQRAALLLFELGDLGHAEIAEAVGCEPIKVKALIFQARTSLAHRSRAREARCGEVREQLATLRGGSLNSRTLKHHVEICEGCAAFREDVRRQRRRVAVILPVFLTGAMHERILATLGLGHGAAGTAGAASGASHAGAASGASHAGAASGASHAGAASGASHAGSAAAAPLKGARLAHLARPRLAALAALATGAAVAASLLIGGHARKAAEPAVPRAQAAPPKPAHSHPVARSAHHAAPAHRSQHHHPAAVHHTHAAPQAAPPAGGLTPAPPRPAPPSKPAPPKKSPPSNPPTARPKPPPPVVPVSSPPASPPASCAPSGNGGGHAWGRCRGADGLPAPAELHRQGHGVPGGPKG
jgi:RNA polymerase sigma factor (sigma-70 family)